jgi:hypothetical protein
MSDSYCPTCGKRAHPKNPCCPSCGMRYRYPPVNATGLVVIDIDKQTLDEVRRFAIEFDELSGSDRWTARDFVDWLAPSTIEYQEPNRPRRDYDGIHGTSDAGIPVVPIRSNRARVMEGNDSARSSMELQPQESLRNGKDRQEGRG